MASPVGVSKGGSVGNSNGSSTTNTNYANNGETAGVQAGQTQTSQQQTQNGQTTGSFQTGVTTPEGYTAAWQGSQPTTLGNTANNYFSNQTDRNSYTLGSLADKAAAGVPGYSSYAAPTPVAADQVQAGTGASYMGNYTQPWQQVTDSALNAYDTGAKQTIGAFKGANAPFAGNDRINSLGQAALTDQIASGRGALAGNLLGQGYTTAANLGQQDASRVAGVDAANADRTLNAGQFNNTLTNQRQEADVQSAYQGDAMRDSAANSQLNAETAGNTANNQWLQLGQALFGQTGSNTGTSDTTSDLSSIANTFGINLGTSSDTGSAASTSTNSNHSSSKGGSATAA